MFIKNSTKTGNSIQKDIDYLRLMYDEQNLPMQQLETRLTQIHLEHQQTGEYWQTTEELSYGAKLAWRNSVNCIGRIFWKTLNVRDLRHLTTAEEIFEAIVEHIQFATNGGNIRSTISIFAPNQAGQSGIRIWNPLLIRYAGYPQPDGSIIGDPDQVELTRICQHMGWKGKGTRFDILPLIIQMPGKSPKLFELSKQIVMEVPITHPDYPWFADLGLKWHALPAVSDWRLEIGSISYSAAPFNGWYMSTEIGARNFGDAHRYNMLPVIAERMGLNTRSKLSLWKDRALIELNTAVLHSFTQHGVSIVDHHTASTQFMRHVKLEEQVKRITPADWSRIVSPISGSATEVFHQEFKNICLQPNFFPQPIIWQHNSESNLKTEFQSTPEQNSLLTKECPFHNNKDKKYH